MPVDSDPNGWFEEMSMPYSVEVYGLLEEMGLATKRFDVTTGAEQWYVDECIKAGKWHYWATQDEFFLSSIPTLSAICRSATNVDMCDRKFQVSYLVKYISGKEEHQLVEVSGTKDISELKVTTEQHAHEKITHCKRLVERREAKTPHLGREISLAEVVWFNLGFSYTYCTADFVHTPTLPLADRVTSLKRSLRGLSDNVPVEELPCVMGRASGELPEWRRFTPDQLLHLEDYMKSPYCCDATSMFNIRPPELLFFDNLTVYTECFVTMGKTRCTAVITADVARQKWFDGLSHRVLLRASSVDKAVSFVRSKAQNGDSRACEMFDAVFAPIYRKEEQSLNDYVYCSCTRPVVSVTSTVKPWDRTQFMVHLCMLLGNYETECSLFCTGSLVESIFKCGILERKDELNRQDVLSLVRRYIVEDLRFYPISARQFSKYVKAAVCTLEDVLVKGSFNSAVCFSDTVLKDEADELLKGQEKGRKLKIVSSLLEDDAIRNVLPDALSESTIDKPLEWIPTIHTHESVTRAAIDEQSDALDVCVGAINRFTNPRCDDVRFPCLVGRPGSGKSHVLKLSVAYAISKGLQVELLSWTSERARKLGGNHLHIVFPFVVSNQLTLSSSSLAASCLANIYKDPMKKMMLKRTDVLVFEEIGMLSAEYFVAIDSVLQTLMGTNSPLGGKLLLCCGDYKQLPPIDGRPIWTSLNMCTVMDVFMFTADVRAQDPQLSWLNTECRRQLTTEECSDVATTILSRCRFVETWSEVPDLAVRIVATKAAEIKVMDEFLKNHATTDFTSIDEVQNGAVWERASERMSKQLNKYCYEYRVCKLYVNAIVRMTYNERQSSVQFSQGQIAIVVALPDESAELLNKRIRLRLAPPGTRALTTSNIPSDWPEIVVGPRTTPAYVTGKNLQMGRRTQFPVRYYTCSTIHRIQGDTIPLIATQLSLEKKEFKLWQREQLAVIISRVRSCDDIIFVGSRTETRAAIECIMSRTSKWDSLIDHVMSELNVARQRQRVRHITLDFHPFTPMYRELPSSACGYVYMLASLSAKDSIYIGETDDLRCCLYEHNTGYGPDETRNTCLHPWGVYAFIVGFGMDSHGESVTMRQDLVNRWRAAVNCDMNPDQAFDVGKEVANESTLKLTSFIQLLKPPDTVVVHQSDKEEPFSHFFSNDVFCNK